MLIPTDILRKQMANDAVMKGCFLYAGSIIGLLQQSECREWNYGLLGAALLTAAARYARRAGFDVEDVCVFVRAVFNCAPREAGELEDPPNTKGGN